MTMVEDIATLSKVESDDFWMNAKTRLFIENICIKDAKILDVGCGTGLLSSKLANRGYQVDAIDFSEFSVEQTKKKILKEGLGSRVNVWRSTIDTLDFKEKYDYIILSDVLEHIKNDTAALEKSYGLLKNGGYLIISAPALKCLYGKHDIYCEHFRRYSRKELYSKLKNSNFDIVSMRYWNILMVPAAFILSKILKRTYPHSNVNSRRSLNKLLEWYYINFENKINFSIGLSLFAVAQKREPV